MKSIVSSAGAALLTLGCASLDDSNNWVDIKDPQELRALFTNKVFTGMTWYREVWTGRYWADGEGLFQTTLGGQIHLYWEVVGNDQVCFTSTSWGTVCRKYARHRTDAGEYRAINPANKYDFHDFSAKSF